MAIEDAEAPPEWASEASKRLTSLALRATTLCTRKTHMAHLLLSPFALHLYELASILTEIQREAEIRRALLDIFITTKMEQELKRAEHLINSYAGSCSLYLLMCSPDLVQQLKRSYHGFESALDSIYRQDYWSSTLKHKLSEELKSLRQASSVKLNHKEHSLQDSLDPAVLDTIVSDRSLATKLAKQVAEALGFATIESEGFLDEIDLLKKEKDVAQLRRGPAHGLYIQQFITVLDKAVAAATRSNSGSMRSQSMATPVSPAAVPAIRDTLILPLQSFICPITQDVMRDPVQIASGQTFERSAIERWFAEGHTRCPTGVELPNTAMKSNIALKQSIAEWRERNNTIRVNIAGEHLSMGDNGNKEEQIKALENLQELCVEESLYKYKLASKGLVPSIVHLTCSVVDAELRQKALCLLVDLSDNEECQDNMIKEKVIETAVKCMAKQKDEVALWVQLLCRLSINPRIAETISHVPSAVIFLVTLIPDDQCSENVKTILDNLPKTDENIITMAKANIIEPLVKRLIEGETSSKVLMAKTFAELHMPDSTKTMVAAYDGAILTLTNMSQSFREEEREAAVMALASLSSVTAGIEGIQAAGSLGNLLEVLKGVRHSENAKLGSATVFANVWSSDRYENHMDEALLEEVVCIYLNNLGPPTPVKVQKMILKGLLHLAQGHSETARMKMKESDAFTCLLRFFHTVITDTSLAHVLSSCLGIIACLAKFFPREAAEALLLPPPGSVHKLAELVIEDTRRTDTELVSVISVFASLPTDNILVTEAMIQEQGLLHSLIRILKSNRSEGVVEQAAGALLRFTAPGDVQMQKELAKAGVVDAYVSLLRAGSQDVKAISAKALFNFSRNTKDLSEHAGNVELGMPGGGGSGGWKSMMACFSGPRRRSGICCKVHEGRCSVEDTFCILEAGNREGLKVVVEAMKEGGACAIAAMGILGTLLEEDHRLDERLLVIEKAGGVRAIIGLMGVNHSTDVQMEAARLCLKFFNVPQYRIQYASHAQMHIITLVQRGTPPLRQLAGKLLRDLDLIQSQSNYFGAASITAS